MNKLRILLVVAVLSMQFTTSYAAHVFDTLYINRGDFLLIDTGTVYTKTIPALAFNRTTTFDQKNALIKVSAGDVLRITVINNDTAIHNFAIDGLSADYVSDTLNPGDTVSGYFTLNHVGCYIYSDKIDYPNNRYMGLAGQISVIRPGSEGLNFFWNIREHQAELNEGISDGSITDFDWSDYAPEYFTINGYSNPLINEDSVARITGHVGDTLYLYLANTGQSLHGIHFHGYHERIMFSSKFPDQIYWYKDSFQSWSMETLILMIIPDKPGEFPVHDHNLVAVTGGNYYPNGMFITMLIEE